MRRQVLFCVETNKRANTDYRYILSTIDRYYDTSDKFPLNLYFWSQRQNIKIVGR